MKKTVDIMRDMMESTMENPNPDPRILEIHGKVLAKLYKTPREKLEMFARSMLMFPCMIACLYPFIILLLIVYFFYHEWVEMLLFISMPISMIYFIIGIKTMELIERAYKKYKHGTTQSKI